jgi:hypothetical protein
MRVAVRGEAVDDRAAGVAEAEEFGDFVEGFAGGVVTGAAEEGVAAFAVGFEEVGVASADDEGERGEFDGRASLASFEYYGVDVAFYVVYGDEREACGEGDGLGVGESDEEGSGEAGAIGGGYGIELGPVEAGLVHGFADYRHDGAQVFPGGEFGDYASVFCVNAELAGYYR